MPVEERLRTAFADQAEEVRSDVEQRLADVHRRRGRSRAWLAGGLAAIAAVAVTAGSAVLLGGDASAPQPAGPPSQERVVGQGEGMPLGVYVRSVTRDEARAHAFPPFELRRMFGGGETARAEMRFRDDPDGAGAQNGWTVVFVDEAGRRYGRDAGSFFVRNNGDLAITSLWRECFGCVAHYEWSVAPDGRLRLDALPTTQARTPMVRLLESAAWTPRR